MRLGLIARADAGGLATMTREFHRHMRPEATLVIDLGDKGRGPCHDWYPGATWNRGMDHELSPETIRDFLDGLDVVYSAETFYRDDFTTLARRMGVATVLHAMPELWRADHDPPDVVLAPTNWEVDRLPAGTQVLPVPVARDRLPFRPRTSARTFLHVGCPAMLDRDGTQLVVYALAHVRSRCRVVLRLSPITRERIGAIPSRIGPVEVEVVSSLSEDYWASYDADVLLAPRRYGGLCLPIQEAASAGMPVVSLDLPPHNAWVPPETLVPAWQSRTARMVGGTFPIHDADARLLAERIDRLAESPELVERMSQASDAHARSLSWEELAPRYRDVLERAAQAVAA